MEARAPMAEEEEGEEPTPNEEETTPNEEEATPNVEEAPANAEETPAVEEDDEEALAAEIVDLKKQIKQARAAAADADFVEMTDSIHDLGCVKFKIRRKFRGHLAKVTDAHWTLDSQLLLTAGQDGYLIVWDALSGNKLNAVQLKTAWVMACAFAPGKEMVASGGLDDICSVYDLRSRDGEPRLTMELKGHSGYVSGVRFLNEESVLTSSCDHTCALWNLERGKIETSYVGHSAGINAMAVPEADPHVFLTASSDFKCKLWDTRQQEAAQTFEGHDQDINAVTFFPRHEFGFVSACDDGSCRLWDIRADQAVGQYIDDYIRCGATSVSLSSSGRLLIAGYDDYNCHVWDVLREERVGIMPAHDGRISRVLVSPNGLAVATASWDHRCFIWTAK